MLRRVLARAHSDVIWAETRCRTSDFTPIPGQFTAIRYGERLAEIGAVPSIGTVGDSDALAETATAIRRLN
jgi:hypothetical protein